jgi:putative nucleotidyltransferase with HDIG domain
LRDVADLGSTMEAAIAVPTTAAARDSSPPAVVIGRPTDESMVGQVVGPYRVIAELGSGAMGKVYTGEHVMLGRRVAIKVLQAAFAADEDSVARFVDEARVVTSIRHPNIVDVIDFGSIDGRSYYVMELLEGETLGERLARERVLGFEAAVRVAEQIAAALASAHDRGIVHRDLKPDNTFLSSHPDYPDHVKVLDFGVAKLVATAEKAAKRRTRAGTVLGTPLYMSPEQCLGSASLDHRSDVYALGVMLYEMVAGVTPFDGEPLAKVLLAHVSDPPVPPREHRPDLPPALEAVILRALEKAPRDRYADMRQMRQAMTAALGMKRMQTAPVAPPPSEAEGKATAASPRVVPPARTARPAAGSVKVDAAVVKPVGRPVRDKLTPAFGVPARPAAVAAVAAAGGAAQAHAMTPTLAIPEMIAASGAEVVDPASEQSRIRDLLVNIILERIRTNRLVLPGLPVAALTALRELSHPNINIGRVAKVLSDDPLLTPQLLWLASSPVYGAGRAPRTVDQAVARLGLRRLRSVLYELAARTVFESPRQRIRDAFRGLWDHSVTVAGLARRVNTELGNPCDGDEMHLAGLLHDAGKPVVGSLLLEAEKVLAREGRWLDDQAWIDVIGSSHRVVGCALADKWNMAPEVKRVIVNCDRYGEGAGAMAANIVCFANAVAKQAGKSVGPIDKDLNEELVGKGAEVLGLDWRFVHTLVVHVGELERLYAPPPAPAPGK